MLVLLAPGLLVLLLPAVRITGSCQTRLPAPAAHWRKATMSVADTSTAAPNVTEAAAALQGQLHVQASGQVRGLDERIFGFNRLLIGIVKGSIDAAYSYQDDDTLLLDVRRFYVLETVARVPYFAYLSVLHLRETLGERDLRETMRLHYAEADNELHHLLIMEALGGNATAFDRTLARTMAFFYYWYVVGVYVLSPEAAYHLSELIEDHAYNTYDTFLTKNEAKLRTLPVPEIARTCTLLMPAQFSTQLCVTSTSVMMSSGIVRFCSAMWKQKSTLGCENSTFSASSERYDLRVMSACTCQHNAPGQKMATAHGKPDTVRMRFHAHAV